MATNGWSAEHGPLNFETLQHLYRSRLVTPVELVGAVFARIRVSKCPNVWISLVDEAAALHRARALEESARHRGIDALPLYGVPFAVKDNIHVAGTVTTAAYRDLGAGVLEHSPVVEKLLAAGAIYIGKTNLDQFATGLTGLVSAYGPSANPFDADYIAGGSSSGSAVAVAAGMVSFSLGTDTAGSGRIPAAFNHLVGLKPTRGLVSTRGLFPACRSLDCISFLTLNVQDATQIMAIAKGFDPADPYSRPDANDFDLSLLKLPLSRFRFGTPPRRQLEFYGDAAAEHLYDAAVSRLESLPGAHRVEIDADPFFETGKLLYQGPWIAERLLSVQKYFDQDASSFHPVTRRVMEGGIKPSAMDVFSGLQKLAELRRRADSQWALMDVLVLPTAARITTVAEALADPAATSAQLGLYTNFVNLLDLAALALPAGFTPLGLPWGISLIAPALSEANLLALGQRFFPDRCGGLYGKAHVERSSPGPLVPSPLDTERPRRISLCVVGAHLSGQPLNCQLTELDGLLISRTRTAAKYRLYALAGTHPPKPGLVRTQAQTTDADGQVCVGMAIDVEVWSLPEAKMGFFLSKVAPPLCLGNIQLEDGQWVKGFLCEAYATAGARDISEFGGWRNYLAAGQLERQHV